MQCLPGKNMASCTFLHHFQGSLKLMDEVNPFSALKELFFCSPRIFL